MPVSAPTDLMWLSNRGGDVKYLRARRCVGRVHGCLRGQHRSPHDGDSRDEPSMWTTHFAESAVQPHQRIGSAHVPGRDASGVQILNAIRIYAVAPAFGLKSSPVLSIECIITASLRATATAARLKPILSRSWRPNVRRALSVELRVRITDAAS